MVCLVPEVEKIDTSMMAKITTTMWILFHAKSTKRNVKSQSIKAAEIGSFKFYVRNSPSALEYPTYTRKDLRLATGQVGSRSTGTGKKH